MLSKQLSFPMCSVLWGSPVLFLLSSLVGEQAVFSCNDCERRDTIETRSVMFTWLLGVCHYHAKELHLICSTPHLLDIVLDVKVRYKVLQLGAKFFSPHCVFRDFSRNTLEEGKQHVNSDKLSTHTKFSITSHYEVCSDLVNPHNRCPFWMKNKSTQVCSEEFLGIK